MCHIRSTVDHELPTIEKNSFSFLINFSDSNNFSDSFLVNFSDYFLIF